MATYIPTVEDIQKQGYISGNDGKQYTLGSQEATNYLLESSKKLVQPVSEPTVGSIYGGEFKAPSYDSNIDSAITQGLDLYGSAANTPINEDQIRSTTLARFQQEVDAVNAIYGEKLREVQLEGQNRLGSGRAIAARSGTLGSDFGAAQKDKIQTGNRRMEDMVRQEQMAKIASIMNMASGQAAEEIAAKRAAQKEGLDSYLKFLGAKTERRSTGLNNLAAAFINQGVDPTSMSPEQLSQLARTYGVSTDDILASYATSKKTADAEAQKLAFEQAKDRRFTLNEGDAIYEIQDDGSYKFIGKNPKTSAPGSGSSGTKVSLTTAKTLNLPLSLVGQSQDQVISSLLSSDVPAWFVEKAQNEAQQSLLPEYVAELWEAYRNQVNSSFESDGGDDDISAILNALGN